MRFILAFCLGACLGSFVPCLAHQLVFAHFNWRARSSCDYCHHPLSWKELIPLISQARLHSRCPYCHQVISSIYWQSELAGGSLAIGVALMAAYQAWSPTRICLYSILLVLLAVMAACDLWAYWVPDILQLACLPFSFFLAFYQTRDGWKMLVIVLALGFLILLQILHPHWLGGADIKLLGLLWLSLPLRALAWLLGLAAGLGLLMVGSRPRRWHQPIPFVPAIALAYYLVLALLPWLT